MNETELQQVNPLLLEFLDLETFKERSEFLMKHREAITDRLIEDMGMSQDVFFEDKSVEEKVDEMIHCMDMHAKYETNRFR